jgi:hypothetical protein
MPLDARQLENEGAQNHAATSGRKVRLLTLADLDGRTNAAKAARALVADLESDLGGADRLSAGEREIAQRAAIASAILHDIEAGWLSGRGIDIAAYTSLANTQSRLLKLLGLERRARDVTPDLPDYIQQASPDVSRPLSPPPY